MKVIEIIDFKVRDLARAGVTPRFLVLTPRALELLCQELGQKDAAPLLQADPTVTYKNMEVVIADLPRFDPITVSGAVRDELDLYNLRVKEKKPA